MNAHSINLFGSRGIETPHFPNPLARLDELESKHRVADMAARNIMLAGSTPRNDQLLANLDRAREVEIERLQDIIISGQFLPGEFTKDQIRRVFQ